MLVLTESLAPYLSLSVRLVRIGLRRVTQPFSEINQLPTPDIDSIPGLSLLSPSLFYLILPRLRTISSTHDTRILHWPNHAAPLNDILFSLYSQNKSGAREKQSNRARCLVYSRERCVPLQLPCAKPMSREASCLVWFVS